MAKRKDETSEQNEVAGDEPKKEKTPRTDTKIARLRALFGDVGARATMDDMVAASGYDDKNVRTALQIMRKKGWADVRSKEGAFERVA